MSDITKIFEELIGLLRQKLKPGTKCKNKSITTDLNVSFLQKKYYAQNCVIHIYDDFKKLGDNREEFNKIQKRFLEAVFEQSICKHYCVAPIVSWSIFSENIYNNDDDDDDDKEILPPAFSIATKNYIEGNLYDYMAKWGREAQFDPTKAATILFGLASAFLHICQNGYSYSNLSPKNIYLETEKINTEEDQITFIKPLVGDLGLLDERNFDDPDMLRPKELAQTNDPQIIKFLVSLYFLFQKPVNTKNGHKSIIKDFYKLKTNLIPKGYILDDNVSNKIIGNPQLFLKYSDLYTFSGQDNNIFDAFSQTILQYNDKKGTESQTALNSQTSSDNSSIASENETVNIKTINNAILNIRDFKESEDSMSSSIKSQFLIYFPLLAVAYASGDLESYPNLCHAAYYAQLANHISSDPLPTSILTKYPTAIYETEAERLFHEGEVLEGNAYAFSEEGDSDENNQETVNKILTMAANKYKESAKLGFDKSKTRLAMLIIGADSSSTSMKKNAFERLLLPAAKTDPLAMFEVGTYYMKENKLKESLKYLQMAYSNNHPDSIYQLARVHHMIALEILKNDGDNSKNEIIENLKKAHNLYEMAARLYDNSEAASMKDKIQDFFTLNSIQLESSN